MSLSAGTRLGPYEILAAIGAGGMGEVYRARDTRLDRVVAIKVAQEQFSDRFEREARAIAALNHPNICTLHDVGPNYLVMELVEGPTLAERIHGAVPSGLSVTDALSIARQIADALEAAHEKGIVHRDLKPGNVKVTPDGVVKVLDFGLAKALSADGTSAVSTDLANSPTLTNPATQLGVILGTAAYMAPEQAAGKPVDKRADIWAFGVVLWEMLTGQALFDGETVSHTLADVLRAPIDPAKLPPTTPAPIRALLRRCLDRDVKTRLRDIGEARVAIQQWIVNPVADAGPAATHTSRRASRLGPIAWVVAGLAIVIAAALAFVHFRETAPETRLLNTSLLPPDGATFDIVASRLPALSPDGQRVVFSARTADGKAQLWLRPLDSPTALPLPGTELATAPFWSPDGHYVGFTVGTQLKKVSVSGGPPVLLAELPALPRGASWSPTGVIVCAVGGGLVRVPEAGGLATPIGSSDPGIRLRPWFLPDGRHFLYLSYTGSASAELRAASLDEPNQPGKVVAHPSSNAMYAEGYLLYLQENTLMAQPFDPTHLETVGEAVPIVERISWYSANRTGAFTVSSTGLLLHHGGADTRLSTSRLRWIDRRGAELGTLGDPENLFGDIEFSPDRKRLLASIVDPRSNTDLWIYDAARGTKILFTSDPAGDPDGVWSPDGKKIVWRSSRTGAGDLYQKAADGTGTDEPLYKDAMSKRATSWSPDGTTVLFSNTGVTQQDLWVLPLSPDQPGGPLKARSFLQTKANERVGQFSPDGKWVAFESNESGPGEIYAIPYPAGGKVIISHGGGTVPRWRRDYKEIFYVGPAGDLVATEISVRNGTLETGRTQKLFGGVITSRGYQYDVFDDKGQKFLVARQDAQTGGAQAEVPPLTLVQNWTKLLKR